MTALAERPADVRVQTESQPVRAVTAGPAEAPQPVAQQAGCPNLSAALSSARDRCRMASKDGFNDYHKYKYASADEVINVAKAALEGTGLAVIPQAQKLVTLGDGSATIFALNRTIFLSHSSGEFIPLSVEGWPVIPEKGRPMDKALAVALTCSLAYLLRDLLQMPRGDEADMNTRDDREHEPPKAAAKPQAASPTGGASPAMLRKELAAGVAELAKLRNTTAEDVERRMVPIINSRFKVNRSRFADFEPGELHYAADSVQLSLAKARAEAEAGTATATLPKADAHPTIREPGEDPEDEPEPVPAKPAGTGKPLKALVDQTFAVLRECGVTWADAIAATAKGKFLGRTLPRDARIADLTLEEHDRIQQFARREKASKDAEVVPA